MVQPERRNFNCPETDEPCTDRRCAKEHCCEREKLQAATTRELAAKQERIFSAKIWEIIRPIIRR
jgi:hypothetical protein